MALRILASIVLSPLMLLGLSIPVDGAPDATLNQLVDGSFTGSGTLDQGPAGCPDFSTIQDYTYGEGEPPGSSGTVHVEGCVAVSGESTPFATNGTFELVSGTSSTLSGSFAGTTTGDTFDVTFTVESGTRDFAGATGTIAVTGTADTHFPTIDDIQGTFEAALERPSSPSAEPPSSTTTIPPSPPAVAVEQDPNFTG